jgi:hypothetical protein
MALRVMVHREACHWFNHLVHKISYPVFGASNFA